MTERQSIPQRVQTFVTMECSGNAISREFKGVILVCTSISYSSFQFVRFNSNQRLGQPSIIAVILTSSFRWRRITFNHGRRAIKNAAIAAMAAGFAEMDFLQRATGALQAQALTAKSDAQRQQIMADVATLNAEPAVEEQGPRGRHGEVTGSASGPMARSSGFGTSADPEKLGTGMEMGAFGAGTQHQLELPGAILAMMNAWGCRLRDVEEPPACRAQQQNLWLSLMGGLFPGGGSTTSTKLATRGTGTSGTSSIPTTRNSRCRRPVRPAVGVGPAGWAAASRCSGRRRDDAQDWDSDQLPDQAHGVAERV